MCQTSSEGERVENHFIDLYPDSLCSVLQNVNELQRSTVD